MTMFESTALYITLTAYAAGLAFWVVARILNSVSAGRISQGLVAAGLAAQTISIVFRWAAIGHPPVFGTFENALAGSWFVVLVGTWIGSRWRLTPVVPASAAVMGVAIIWFGLRFDQTKYPLTISETSLWVDIHATFAWFDYAALSIALILALAVVTGRAARIGSRLRIGPDFTAVEAVDELLFKLMVIVFVMKTASIASGSYYEFLVFGRWWGWDPVESLSLASWLLVSLFIHLRRSFAWRGRPLAAIVVIAFVLAIIAYWLLVYFPPGNTFHVFDIMSREHVL